MDSNPQPADYKSAALPIELHQRMQIIFFWCLGADSNHRHRDFQSLALPTELPRHLCIYILISCYMQEQIHTIQFKYLATRNGLEPSTSSVTGWRSNQLNYRAKYSYIQKYVWWAFTDSNRGPIGYEPTALTN